MLNSMDGFFKFLVIVIISLFIIRYINRKIIFDIEAIKNIINEKLFKHKFNILSKKDLYNMDSVKYEKWCAGYLEKRGFDIIEVASERYAGGKDIICSKEGQTYYVRCVKAGVYYKDNPDKEPNLNDDEYYVQFGRPMVQKLVGLMYHDGITNGLVSTTGYFSNEAYEYNDMIKEKYNIELVNGDMLSSSCWAI